MKLKKQHKRLLYLIAAISLMGLIYYFSAQTYAEQSLIPWIEKYLSFPFIYRMIEGLEVNYGGQTLSIQTIGYAAFIEFFIRKSLHFLAFACLGFFWYRALTGQVKSVGLKITLALLITIGYASFDEFHQSFQEGRSALVDDLFLDSFGGLAGILIGRLSQSKLWK